MPEGRGSAITVPKPLTRSSGESRVGDKTWLMISAVVNILNVVFTPLRARSTLRALRCAA